MSRVSCRWASSLPLSAASACVAINANPRAQAALRWNVMNGSRKRMRKAYLKSDPAGRQGFPAAPHPAELVSGAEARHLGHAFERQLALGQELTRQPHSQPLHVVERGAMRVLSEEPREIASAGVRDLGQSGCRPLSC